MVFKCQQDSFLTEFEGVVKSCEKSQRQTLTNGKKAKVDGYEVVLDDTILFPEGGGQPSDSGWLNGNEVIHVERRADRAVHFVREPIETGTAVRQKIDWKRRFDHMQQHSGQHLLSAILEREHKLNTTAWWLGEDESHVELDCTKLAADVIDAVEKRCNALIREAIPVTVKVCEKDDPELDQAHTRGLPDDHVGPVRIISIRGIDENLCCGTHVTNLSQLQVIKLTKAEPGKKNKVNLKFLVGDRVISGLQKCIDREQALTALLKNDPGKHVDLVDKLQKSLKVANKNVKNMQTDIAASETDAIRAANPPPKFACFHRKDGDFDYVKAIDRGMEGLDVFYFVAIGEGKQGGNISLQGDELHINKIAPQLCQILNGKGAGKGNRFQAKVEDLTHIAKCFDLIKCHFENHTVNGTT